MKTAVLLDRTRFCMNDVTSIKQTNRVIWNVARGTLDIERTLSQQPKSAPCGRGHQDGSEEARRRPIWLRSKRIFMNKMAAFFQKYRVSLFDYSRTFRQLGEWTIWQTIQCGRTNDGQKYEYENLGQRSRPTPARMSVGLSASVDTP